MEDKKKLSDFKFQNLTREQYLFLAQVASQMERSQQALEFILKAIKIQPNLNINQKQLFKSIFNTERRKVWRGTSKWNFSKQIKKINSFELKGQQKQKILINTIRNIKTKQNQYKLKVIQILSQEKLMNRVKFLQTQIFYRMILADSYRLYFQGNCSNKLLEFIYYANNQKLNEQSKNLQKLSSQEQQILMYYKQAQKIYKQIYQKSRQILQPVHPLRFQLAQNFANLYYTSKQYNKGVNIAKEAFQLMIENIEQIQQDFYKDTTLIASIMRDNITLYTSQEYIE